MGMSFNAVIRHSFSFPSNLLSLFPSFLRLLSDLAVAVRAAITSFPEMHLGNLAVNFCSSLLMCFVFFFNLCFPYYWDCFHTSQFFSMLSDEVSSHIEEKTLINRISAA